MARLQQSWLPNPTYGASPLGSILRYWQLDLDEQQVRRRRLEAEVDQRLQEGTAGQWVEVPKGAYAPGRDAGFPNGFEVTAPRDYLMMDVARPHWICGKTGQRLRPVGDALARWSAGWTADRFQDAARLRGYTSKADLNAMVDAADIDWGEKQSLRHFLDLADTTPRPPLYLYAESFSPPVVLARHKVYMPDAPPELIELDGRLIVRRPDHVVLPVWDLGKGQPFADALGRTWDRSVGTA